MARAGRLVSERTVGCPPAHRANASTGRTRFYSLRMKPVPLLATTLIGSYPQPDWLIDRERLRSTLPARVRARELWRVPEPLLSEAQDDATALAIRDFERAGVDILTDGEIRRESYSNRFATALEGMDVENPAIVPGRAGGTNAVPRVTGPVRRTRPVEVADLRFLRAQTERPIKITLPGPFTMSQQAHNEFYPDAATLAMDLAAAVAEEVHELFAAGADVVQLDEPWLQARSRGGAGVRGGGDQPGATGRTRHDRAAHLLRLRPRRSRAPVGLPVPGRAGGLRRRPARDRGRPATARPGGAAPGRGQDDHRRRARSGRRRRRGDARDGGSADRAPPRGAYRPSACTSARTAG